MKEKLNPEEGIKLDISAEILEICIKFMHYKLVNRMVSFERKEFHIDPVQVPDVLKAAIYLQC